MLSGESLAQVCDVSALGELGGAIIGFSSG